MKRIALILLAVVLIIGLPMGIYIGVFASAGVRGRIAASNIINDPVNRIGVYNHFFDIKQAYDANVAQIPALQSALTSAKQAVATQPDPLGQLQQQETDAQTNITGVIEQCVNNATQYNTDSTRLYTEAQFKGANLPFRLNATACYGQGSK